MYGLIGKNIVRKKWSLPLLLDRTIHVSVGKNSKNVTFVSTPIFYVNAKPHIGHLYTSLLADAYSRWCKIKGEKVLFSTGTDEHGLKVQEAAIANNQTPVIFCDDISSKFSKTFDLFDIKYDDYIRTSEKRHSECVHKLWDTIWDNGYIYVGKHEGWYCTSDETFLPDSQVTTKMSEETNSEIKVSAESGHPVVWFSEENYMFRLSAFEKPIIEWLNSNQDVIYPRSKYNEVKSFILTNGLSDISISRKQSTVEWAIPVPKKYDGETTEAHSIYVWLDALANYLTVSGFGSTWNLSDVDAGDVDGSTLQNSKTAKYGWPATCHIVGKDILKFHAIYWPAFLLAAGLPLPKKIVAHGHWTVNNVKMSKSIGNVVDPIELFESYGVDPVRYFLLRDGNISNDGDFSSENLELRRDVELADTLGNLLTRATGKAMLPNGLVLPSPVPLNEFLEEDLRLRKSAERLFHIVPEYYDQFEFGNVIFEIMNVLRDTNRYFTMMEPWAIRKRVKNAIRNGENGAEMDAKRADTIVYNTLEVLRICTLLLQPIVPKISENILTYLNEDERGILNIDNEGIWREGNVQFNGVYGQPFKIIDKERQQ
eukprot:g9035.t1